MKLFLKAPIFSATEILLICLPIIFSFSIFGIDDHSCGLDGMKVGFVLGIEELPCTEIVDLFINSYSHQLNYLPFLINTTLDKKDGMGS